MTNMSSHDFTDIEMSDSHPQDDDKRALDCDDVLSAPLVSVPARIQANNLSRRSRNAAHYEGRHIGFHVGEHEQISANQAILAKVHSSTLITGTKQSGKSTTLACMVENAVTSLKRYGPIDQTPAVLMMRASPMLAAEPLPAHVAALCEQGIQVQVFVAKSETTGQRTKLTQAYERLPGAKENLAVHPFRLGLNDVDIDTMCNLNQLIEGPDDSDAEDEGHIGRECAQVMIESLYEVGVKNGDRYDNDMVKAVISEYKLPDDQQQVVDNQFLHIAITFGLSMGGKSMFEGGSFGLQPGTVTIVDLAFSEFEQVDVCTAFDICLTKAKEVCFATTTKLLVAIEDLHDFIDISGAASMQLLENLENTIKLNPPSNADTGIILTTKEFKRMGPLLDVVPVTIVHRVQPDNELAVMSRNLAAAKRRYRGHTEHRSLAREMKRLEQGEAFVFSASACVCVDNDEVKTLGQAAMKMWTMSRPWIAGSQEHRAIEPVAEKPQFDCNPS